MKRHYAAVVVLLATATSAHAQNLLRNPSFETVPAPAAFGQGLLASEWQDGTPISPASDIYSTDGSYGLTPGDFGHFAGATAQDGIRFVAGADFGGGVSEALAQLLTTPLTAGQTYTVSAYLMHDYPSLGTPAGYEILLSDIADYGAANAVSVGMLAATTGVDGTGADGWQFRSTSFTAPANAGLLPFFILRQRSANGTDFVYPAIDAVSLVAGTAVAPEPGTLLLLALPIVGLVCRRR